MMDLSFPEVFFLYNVGRQNNCRKSDNVGFVVVFLFFFPLFPPPPLFLRRPDRREMVNFKWIDSVKKEKKDQNMFTK